MFEYTFKTGDKINILTPFCSNLSEVDRSESKSPDSIKSVSVYPNGFKIETTQTADKIIVKTNKELVDNGDGTMSVRL